MDKQRVLVSLVITGLILFGAALAIRGGLNSYQSLLSYGWQETQAKVLTNHIGRFRPSGARQGTDFYQAEVGYEYIWQGIKHRGELLYPDYSGDRTREDAEARLAPYGIGQRVPCISTRTIRDSRGLSGAFSSSSLAILSLGWRLSCLACGA
ncbi:DUF3592 domain-containing protein [Shewanella aegiceratis]|uniref:DUF3592 domain-containing protein n=1 Tax=Shewanella aegiceratis TaxID=2864203 RepID=UPI001C65CAF8|nr:DUF3592 domain-containing protein [Shewanella aegiceratis]QYJ81849.1 DUF3592 domain-containing protein [Shewanella aegiceratis]